MEKISNMNAAIQPKQSDSVTTITSVTFISITMALMTFLKTRPNQIVDIKFGYILMIIAILLFASSAFLSYVDISKACYSEGEQMLNFKIGTYFLGLFSFGIAIIYIITI